MDLSLEGKTAVVSGSTAGIGYKVALGLAKLGADVVISGRSAARVEDAVAKLTADLGSAAGKVNIKGVVADLGTSTGCEDLCKEVPSCDVLVNNVGIFEPIPFLEVSDETWLRYYEVNVMSGVRLSRHYFPKMLEKNWGRIIFVSSESGINVAKEMIHYSMSKTSQLVLSRGLAELTAGTGVTVNSVTPGPTETEGVQTWREKMAKQRGISEEQLEKEFFQETRPTSLIQRFLTEEEVANSVLYLASKASSGTNGGNLPVDGGCVRKFC